MSKYEFEPDHEPDPETKVEVDRAGGNGRKTAVGASDGSGDDPMMSAMCNSNDPFKILQVDPKADIGLISRVFTYLAQKYHADSPETCNDEMYFSVYHAFCAITRYRDQLETCDTQETPELYRTLQLAPGAEIGVIQEAFEFLKRKYHPDNTATGSRDILEKTFNAFNILSDPTRKAEYDRSVGVNEV